MERKSNSIEETGSKEVKEAPTRSQSRTILRKPTFREVEERFFPGKSAANSQKNKLVKSQSLDSDCRGSGLLVQEVPRVVSPGNNRPQTPKWGGETSIKPVTAPTGKQGRWLSRRAREVFLDKGALEEKPGEARQGRSRAATEVESPAEGIPGNTKPRQLMKKLFQR